MANGPFKIGIQKIIQGSIDLDTDDLRLALIRTAEGAFNLGTYDFMSDIGGANIAGRSAQLASVTVTNGVLDVADGNFGAVSGTECDRVVLYAEKSGTDATRPVIYQWDTFASGMPVTPNGGTINFTVAAGTLVDFAATPA